MPESNWNLQRYINGAALTERNPLFSVVIPTYNRAALVKQAVVSALAQTFDSFEVIVIDDGSADATMDALAPFAGCIRLLSQKNSGPEQARNYGIGAARGDYIVFLDSDDLLMPHALSVYRDVIVRNHAALIVAHATVFSDDTATAVPPDNGIPQCALYKDVLSKKQPLWLSTSFLVVNRVFLIDRKISFKKGTFPVDDLDFILRAGTMGPCIFINKPATVSYRYHATNSVCDIMKNIDRCEMVIGLEKHGAYPGGRARAFDRFALIGGHVQCWGRKGLRAGFFIKSCRLFYKGFWMLWAIAIKKVLDQIGR